MGARGFFSSLTGLVRICSWVTPPPLKRGLFPAVPGGTETLHVELEVWEEKE